jgi:hypothetical protein
LFVEEVEKEVPGEETVVVEVIFDGLLDVFDIGDELLIVLETDSVNFVNDSESESGKSDDESVVVCNSVVDSVKSVVVSVVAKVNSVVCDDSEPNSIKSKENSVVSIVESTESKEDSVESIDNSTVSEEISVGYNADPESRICLANYLYVKLETICNSRNQI